MGVNKTFKMKFIIFFVTISFGTIFSRETFVNGSDDEWIETNCDLILDYRENPILRATDILEWILGDPTIVLLTGEEKLEKSEDQEEVGELHMFANEIFHGILHFSANYNDPF